MKDKAEKNLKRALTVGAGVLIPIPGVQAAVGVNALFSALFERNGIAPDHKPLGTGTPYEEEFNAAQAWCRVMPFETLSVSAEDGITLVGHYLRAPAEERTVILCHGWHSEWDRDLASQAKWLYERNCSLLLIEQRAHGNSGGEYLTFGLLEHRDLLCWIELINRLYDPKRLYLMGQSMGGTTVLMAAGEDLPGNVRGVIDDCGFTSPYEQIVQASRSGPVWAPEHPMMDLLNAEAKLRMGVGLKDHSAVDAMRVTKLPVLFIHGMADKTVNYDRTMENYVACKTPKRLVLAEGAAHCMCWYLDRQQYADALAAFFAENDGYEQGTQPRQEQFR